MLAFLAPYVCDRCDREEDKLFYVQTHIHGDLTHMPDFHCSECGGDMAFGDVVERYLGFLKGRYVRTPRSLPAPYPRSKVTCEWLAWFVHQKIALLTPLDRIRRDLAERGVSLAMGTLVSFIESAADLLAPIDGLHWQKLLSRSWMATDSTGLKVLVRGLPVAHNGYLELYRDQELAVFQYEAAKGGEAVAAKLAPFRGTITCDAEHRFNSVFASGRVIESGCNAHGRRKFRDAEAAQPGLAVEGGAFIGAMYGEEEKAQRAGLVGEKLLAHRQRHIKPIVADFEKWLVAVEPALLPSEPLAAAVRYYRNHRDALFRFVPVQAYLAWAFERLGTHRDVFALPLDEMTPAAFKRAGPGR